MCMGIHARGLAVFLPHGRSESGVSFSRHPREWRPRISSHHHMLRLSSISEVWEGLGRSTARLPSLAGCALLCVPVGVAPPAVLGVLGSLLPVRGERQVERRPPCDLELEHAQLVRPVGRR
eukprot:2404725-Prymnesium_polylepis.1